MNLKCPGVVCPDSDVPLEETGDARVPLLLLIVVERVILVVSDDGGGGRLFNDEIMDAFQRKHSPVP